MLCTFTFYIKTGHFCIKYIYPTKKVVKISSSFTKQYTEHLIKLFIFIYTLNLTFTTPCC